MDWMDIREDASNYVNNLHENALKHYLQKIGLKDTFVYKYDYNTNKFTIYTCRPGIWIGKGGVGVELLRAILSKEVEEGCDVEFKEVRGRFVVCQ